MRGVPHKMTHERWSPLSVLCRHKGEHHLQAIGALSPDTGYSGVLILDLGSHVGSVASPGA